MISMVKLQLGNEEKQAVLDVLDSGMLAQGPRVKEFEDAFAEMIGVSQAIATSSGTTALQLALLANGIKEGDEVITSPFTFIASANSILYVGARPVFVDIDPKTFNLDPNLIESAITPRTKAIMPVHLYGLCSDMEAIQAIAQKYNLAIIEDACQSHGATCGTQKAGSFGTGAFSFYATKNMTSGEGGMITTNDPAIAEHCRVLRQHGSRRRYYHDELGYNFRMTDIQAAIGLPQLRKLAAGNRARQENARYLNDHLQGVTVPYTPDGYQHVYHQYTVRIPAEKREGFCNFLQERGIGYAVFYPVPIHQQKVYLELGYQDHLPEAEKAAQEVVSLPIHPGLSQEDLAVIVSTVNEYMGVSVLQG